MITQALRVVATWSHYKGLFVLVAVLMGLWMSGTLSGHTASAPQDSHFYWVKDTQQPPLVGWYAVTMHSDASTHEYRSGSVMVMDVHNNSLAVKNGKCNFQYPFCWGALNTPRTTYSHPGNSYTLTQWSNQSCFYTVDDHYKCWESFLQLGWLTIPVAADAYRNVPISLAHWPQYAYNACCPSVTPHTSVYNVD